MNGRWPKGGREECGAKKKKIEEQENNSH